MGRTRRGVRDGSGPKAGSYQRKRTGSRGRRKLAGQKCPRGK